MKETKMIKTKNTVLEMKKSLNKLITGLYTVEEKISECEPRSMENTQR